MERLELAYFKVFFQKTPSLSTLMMQGHYTAIIKNNIKPVFAMGMDNSSGPASFSVIDPDGNPVLIDQHK